MSITYARDAIWERMCRCREIHDCGNEISLQNVRDTEKTTQYPKVVNPIESNGFEKAETRMETVWAA